MEVNPMAHRPIAVLAPAWALTPHNTRFAYLAQYFPT